MRKDVWKEVVQQALANDLDKRLPQAAPKLHVGPSKASWANVAPRTQTIIHLMVSDSGIHLQSSPTNSSSITLLHEVVGQTINGSEALFLTPIRSHSSGVKTFLVKPMPWIKRNGDDHKATLYSALEKVIGALQPFI